MRPASQRDLPQQPLLRGRNILRGAQGQCSSLFLLVGAAYSPVQSSPWLSSRLEPTLGSGKESFVALPDERRQCFDCCLTAVVDSVEASVVYREVVDFMERYLHLRITPEMREVPVLAVDLSSLNEQKALSFHGHGVGIVRGLTLSSYATVSHIAPGLWNLGAGRPESLAIFQTECHREVTAVLVLAGLPRDLTASILAHEAMHVYLKLSKGFPLTLTKQSEEGLCQLVAMRLLSHYLENHQTSADGKSSFRRSLLRYWIHCIESDSSFEYGDGFRKAKKCSDSLGLEITLDHVSQMGSLPDI